MRRESRRARRPWRWRRSASAPGARGDGRRYRRNGSVGIALAGTVMQLFRVPCWTEATHRQRTSARAILSAPSGASVHFRRRIADALGRSQAARARRRAARLRIHLRGIARIDAHVARSHGKLVLSGTVTDDVGAGRTAMRASAASTVDRASGAARRSDIAASAGSPRRAGESGRTASAGARASRIALVAVTDACGTLLHAARRYRSDRYVAHLEASASRASSTARGSTCRSISPSHP